MLCPDPVPADRELAKNLLNAFDPDFIAAEALKKKHGDPLPAGMLAEPTPSELSALRSSVVQSACAPFENNVLRDALAQAKQDAEQTIDTVTVDKLEFAGFDAAAKARAQSLVQSFRAYVEQHKAEITALQILYSRPYAQRLTEPMLKELEQKLRDTDGTWTEENLWRAFAATAPEKVKGRSQAGRFADLVALVRFALEKQPVLEPFADSVQSRFDSWLRQKDASVSDSQLSALYRGEADIRHSQPTEPGSRAFRPDQLSWLRLIADHIATSLSIDPDDFGYSPFAQRGGLGKAHQLFGEQLPKLLEELNETLAA